MKNMHIFLYTLLPLFISSCGTSDNEKIEYQNNTQKSTYSVYDTSGILIDSGLISFPLLVDSVYIPSIKQVDLKDLLSMNKSKAVANLRHTNTYYRCIGNDLRKIKSHPGFWLNIYQVIGPTNDNEISRHIHPEPLSNIELGMAWIHLFSKQSNLEIGKLLTDGNLNMFPIYINGIRMFATCQSMYDIADFGDGWGMHVYDKCTWFGQESFLVFSRRR
ncbi:hypothetical protein COB64_01945 [Candidatus Wolfebacteria bacterium]|nr:MAG: hypothetical protein COB64_01945 [Candidatus Wolfebacteria bacterium]